MISTMAKLFEAAGYKDYKKMEIDKAYPPKNKLAIASYEGDHKVMKEVLNLFYKGEAKSGYKVFADNGSVFIATKNHMLYNADTMKFESLEEIYKNHNGEVLCLDENGLDVKAHVEAIRETFSVLDVEVADTHAYFSASLLSHNSFGSGALALSRVLRRENILCSKYQTPLIEISQERANMNIMSHAIVTTGGTAAPYYASTRNRVKKIDSITDKNGVECGIVMEVRNYKNKTSIPWRKVNIRLLFDGGLDVDSEYEDFFYLLNILKTSGAWVYYEPLQLKWNGKAKVHEYFQSDEGKELYEKLKKEVMAKLTVSNELDKDNVKPSDEDTSAGDKAEAELEKQLEKEDSATN